MDFRVLRSSSDLAASTSLIHCKARVGFFAFEHTSVRKITIQLWNSVVPIPAAWWVTDLRRLLSSRLFSFSFSENKVKVLVAMALHSHFSLFLLFSESPMMLPNFLNHYVILQVLVGQIDDQKRFREHLYHPVYLAARLVFLELDGIRARCETWALPTVLGEWVRILEDFRICNNFQSFL